MHPNIEEFFAEKKAVWLKKKVKATTSEEEKSQLAAEAERIFNLETWLPDGAKRASQLSMTSHPCTFSHPDAKKNGKGKKTTALIAEAKSRPDGFLRSGNCEIQLDVFGNAAALDVDKFLSLSLSDERTILSHLEEDSEEVRKELSTSSKNYQEIRTGLLAIKGRGKDLVTSAKIKQVYFPVKDSYHLLSILNSSSIIFEMRERIQDLSFSDTAKKAREDRRGNEHNDQGYEELLGLTMIGYGGSNPQNISKWNSKMAGKAYLLPSLPPQLKKRAVRLPKTNFFSQNLIRKNLLKPIYELHHHVFDHWRRNQEVRFHRDDLISEILDQVMHQVWMIRDEESGWSEAEAYLRLPKHQKIWLDSLYQEERLDSDDWREKVAIDFARWLSKTYKAILRRDAIAVGDDFNQRILKFLRDQKGCLQ